MAVISPVAQIVGCDCLVKYVLSTVVLATAVSVIARNEGNSLNWWGIGRTTKSWKTKNYKLQRLLKSSRKDRFLQVLLFNADFKNTLTGELYETRLGKRSIKAF